MSAEHGRGRPISEADVMEAVRKVLAGQVGSINLARGAVGAGSLDHESLAGVQNAQYIHLAVSGSGGVYDVSHSLPSGVPVRVSLAEVRNPEGTAEISHAHANVVPISKEKWTESNLRVSVAQVGGASLDRCTLVLKVEGA